VAEFIPTASEAEWLEARRKGVTASEIAVIMGLSPYSSPYALYHQKLGILPADEDQAVFERGRVLEPYIAEKFAEAHPLLAVEGDGRRLYVHPGRPWQLATPDRLVYECTHVGNQSWDLAAVLETKTDAGSDEWGDEGTDEIPVHYRCQVLWQMDVTGVSRAYVSCLDPARWKIREYVIEHAPYCDILTGRPSPDECAVCADQLMMRGEAQLFLGRIDRQDAPDVDWRPATAYALKQLHPSLEDRDAHVGRRMEISYRAAIRHYKDAERRKDEMTNRLREAMGSARRAVARGTYGPDGDRVVIANRQVYEVGESVRKGYTVDKLVPVKPKKES
jgi:putative phage-type endonuclease